MNYIKRDDIPQAIINAITDPYYERELKTYFDRLPAKSKALPAFSSTTLPRAPRQVELMKRHGHKVLVDPIKNGFWKLLGNSVHNILEHHAPPSQIVEVRVGLDFKSGKIAFHQHGKPDVVDPPFKKVQDWKLTSTFSIMNGEKIEHHAQLNLNAYLVRKVNKIKIDVLENVFLFKDFKPSMFREGKAYPSEHIQVCDVPTWSDAKIEQYAKERAEMHLDCANLADEDLPFCTEEDRWVNPTIYRVFKIDPKTQEPQVKAKFKSESEIEAQEWTLDPYNAYEKLKGPDKRVTTEPDKAKPINFIIKPLEGMSAKCDYCEIAAWCNQRQAEIARLTAEGRMGAKTEEEEE